MKHIKLLSLFFLFLSCKGQEVPTQFSQEALNDTFISLQDEKVTFGNILNAHKGKTILIDVWASWCKDCIVSLPELKTLQKEHPEIVFLFLSLDRSTEKWKRGIEKYNISGEHYYMKSGWKGAFGKFLNLDWIPRYLIVDPNQNIKLFKAVKVNATLKQNLQ
ncbi:MAG TPA: TlpA disulfide reductase family protein [Flavobacteriaceae bacterium]|nr:TlpA disulfide reductase family protein [Flavobacteriaceae bacterium]